MPNPNWLERVRARLLRRGLPPDYAARLVEELHDHAAELEERSPGEPVDRMLGAAEEVAEGAVRAYRAGSFAGRHPVAAFVLAPLLGVDLAFSLYINAGIHLVECVGGMESAFAVGLSHILTWLCGFVVPAAVLAAVWRLYRRSGRPRIWFAAAGAMIAVLAGLFFAQFTPPTAGADADLVTEFRFARSWVQAVQFVAVAGLAVWLAGSGRRPDRSLAAC